MGTPFFKILRGGEVASRLAHNQTYGGSIPSPATNLRSSVNGKEQTLPSATKNQNRQGQHSREHIPEGVSKREAATNFMCGCSSMVERHVPNVNVESSSLFSRSNNYKMKMWERQ